MPSGHAGPDGCCRPCWSCWWRSRSTPWPAGPGSCRPSCGPRRWPHCSTSPTGSRSRPATTTSPGTCRRARCSTPGRWPSRSSTTWCGPCWSWVALSARARRHAAVRPGGSLSATTVPWPWRRRCGWAWPPTSLGPNRAYLGTDTRAWELLLGGAGGHGSGRPAGTRPAAGLWSRPHRGRCWPAWSLGRAGGRGPPGWIWDGGLVAIAAVLPWSSWERCGHPTASWRRVLALGPLRWLGLISLQPLPVALAGHRADDHRHHRAGPAPPLLAARLATMVALSCASYYLVERPLRRADWGALPAASTSRPSASPPPGWWSTRGRDRWWARVGTARGHDGRGGRRRRHRRRRPPCPGPRPRLPPTPRRATPTGCGSWATA